MDQQEKKPHELSIAVAQLQPVPKDNATTTPTQLVKEGVYTAEQLQETIEEMIIEGKSYRAICKELNVKLTGLVTWLSKEEHLTRTRTALKISADYYADMSIQVLLDVPEDKIAIMKAKELSSAYRWKARVRDVSKYGEKLDVTSDGQQLVQISLGTGVKPPELTEDVDHIDITNDENPKKLE